MIADSLPDKWGNSLFNAWLRDNNISSKNITPIDHLSFIGSRAMGALEFEPARKLGNNSAYPYAKLEYIYYQMAIDAGINMMPSKIATYGGVTHFLTKRFDRNGNDKIHTQTLAAMSPTSNSYEDIFAVIRRLNLPYDDNKQQYLRMVFNVIARNIDDHSKNFAFCMNRNGNWQLSPAYDVTYSVDLNAPAYSNRHSLTINSKSEQITRKDLEAIGLNNDIQDYKTLIDTVTNAVANFESYAEDLDIDQKVIDAIKADFVSLPGSFSQRPALQGDTKHI